VRAAGRLGLGPRARGERMRRAYEHARTGYFTAPTVRPSGNPVADVAPRISATGTPTVTAIFSTDEMKVRL